MGYQEPSTPVANGFSSVKFLSVVHWIPSMSLVGSESEAMALANPLLDSGGSSLCPFDRVVVWAQEFKVYVDVRHGSLLPVPLFP